MMSSRLMAMFMRVIVFTDQVTVPVGIEGKRSLQCEGSKFFLPEHITRDEKGELSDEPSGTSGFS
jgi:hypothetical protein